MKSPTGAEARLRDVPWASLAPLAPALEAPLAAVLGGAAAERVLDRFLRDHRTLDADGRRAVAEAIFGVGLWRRRLSCRGGPEAPPVVLLALLMRDLGGRPDAAALCGLDDRDLPAPAPPPAALADRWSLPDWLAADLEAAAGAEAPALAEALCRPGPVSLRVNTLRTTREAVAARLLAEGVATRPGHLAPTALRILGRRPGLLALPALREGLVEVQDEGSQLLALALDARPGEAVLDACAGAGGKALALAAAVGAGGAPGRVHACDLDAGRLERLAHRAHRAGADGIVERHGAAPPPGLRVDRALVDAPCSELGPLRRGPDLRWRLDPAAFAPLPALQLRLLLGAAGAVRPGGRLVYATCTFRREENEAVALAFEAARPDYQRVAPAAPAGVIGSDGFLRLWPHRDDTDGFFAAAWGRRLDCAP